MKSYFIKSLFVLLLISLLSGCSINPPTDKPIPGIIISSSPDNRYKTELDLSEAPVVLTILDNFSRQETHIPISYGYYNKIDSDSFKELKWSVNSKLLMFVLRREPNPEKNIEGSSCFFVVDIEKEKLLKVNCSSYGVHIWTPDESGIVTLEHAGLNEPFDYYIPEINCYKNTAQGECVTSHISPSGNWELSPWGESNVTLKNLSGAVWNYSYTLAEGQDDFILTTVQGWSENEDYVLFSPTGGYETARVYGLFQMDLRNGNVISLLENKSLDQRFYYLSVSPSGTKVVYITPDGRAVIKDLNKNTENNFNIQLENNEAIGNFVWSPDELIAVFIKFKYNENNEVDSLDYFSLNLSNYELITLLKNEPEYLNILKMTNSEVIIGQSAYSLVDGAFLR